ncbi:MAG: transporter substrate-binding domain-containing protein, partial [Sulfurimonas sp.]|nr:transporter substrate-binding domain-containing protein [Sulfurimonas sp.]
MHKLVIYLLLFFFPYSLFSSTSIDLNLTPQEREFIAQERVIKYVYDPDWAPFEWENGINEHVGIVADILKHIERKSGLKFQASHSVSWVEAVDKLKNADADMVSSISINYTKKEDLNFTTNTLFSVPYVFVSHNNDYFADGFNSLNSAKLALVKGYAIEEIVQSEYPDLKFKTVSNIR